MKTAVKQNTKFNLDSRGRKVSIVLPIDFAEKFTVQDLHDILICEAREDDEFVDFEDNA